jgi:hypothetical protein
MSAVPLECTFILQYTHALVLIASLQEGLGEAHSRLHLKHGLFVFFSSGNISKNRRKKKEAYLRD